MPINTAADSLSALLPPWQSLLQDWSSSRQLTAAAQEAKWASGDFRNLPPIELLSAQAISGAMGAYAISTGTIYLNRVWLLTASPEQVQAVLTAELGHHLDGLCNVVDTPGDEGELLAALLLGSRSLSPQQHQRLQSEQDYGQVWLLQQPVPVEQAAVVSSTPIRPATPERTAGEFSNYWAFAALKSDGSVVTWGNSDYGGGGGGG